MGDVCIQTAEHMTRSWPHTDTLHNTDGLGSHSGTEAREAAIEPPSPNAPLFGVPSTRDSLRSWDSLCHHVFVYIFKSLLNWSYAK